MELQIPNRQEYTFIGWFAEKNQTIRNETITNISDNDNLHMYWAEAPTNHVENFFSTKDLTHEEIEELLIITKFVDAEEVIKLCQTIIDSSDAKT